jgi:hypothetical protein
MDATAEFMVRPQRQARIAGPHALQPGELRILPG